MQEFQNQGNYSPENEKSFLQYLSLRYYTHNLEELTDKARDSVNNFLKSLSEIEAEFLTMLTNEQKIDLHDFGFGISCSGFTEENY